MHNRSMTNKKKIFIGVGIVLFLLVLVGSTSDSDTSKTKNQTNTTQNVTKKSEAKQPVREPKGTAVTIGAGSFTGGKDVASGLYDVAPGQGESGNFMVSGDDSYNEVLGASGGMGVDKVRAKISDGDNIQISGLSSVTFTPVTSAFITSYSAVTLYSGTFTVGEDIGAGRYTVTPGQGQSGNFVVSGSSDYNEVLGGSYGVSSISANLTKGDSITISGLEEVSFTPLK